MTRKALAAIAVAGVTAGSGACGERPRSSAASLLITTDGLVQRLKETPPMAVAAALGAASFRAYYEALLAGTDDQPTPVAGFELRGIHTFLEASAAAFAQLDRRYPSLNAAVYALASVRPSDQAIAASIDQHLHDFVSRDGPFAAPARAAAIWRTDASSPLHFRRDAAALPSVAALSAVALAHALTRTLDLAGVTTMLTNPLPADSACSPVGTLVGSKGNLCGESNAFFIGPRVALTGAHCVKGLNNLRFYRPDSTTPLKVSRATYNKKYDEHRPDSKAYDLAKLYFDEDVTDSYVALDFGTAYGQTTPVQLHGVDRGVAVCGSNQIANVWDDLAGMINLVSPDRALPAGQWSVPEAGNSGSPLMGPNGVIGVAVQAGSATTPNGTAFNTATYAPIAANAEFILGD